MELIRLNRNVVIAAILLTVAVAIIFVVITPFYLLVIFTHIILGISIWKKIQHPIVLLSIFFITSCLLVEYLRCNYFANSIYGARTTFGVFVPSYLVAVFILAYPFYRLYNYYIKKLGTDYKKEKHNYRKKNYPYLVCKEHYTRTRNTGIDTITVRCRKDWNCSTKKKLIYAKYIVGLIGYKGKKGSLNGNYYVTLWDHKTHKFQDGDFDIIEIYENPKITDYDYIINKVIDYLFNEIERYIPIYQIKVRIYGNLELSTSTKRLLKERFLRIEYLEQ